MKCCLCGDTKEIFDAGKKVMRVCPCVAGEPVSHNQAMAVISAVEAGSNESFHALLAAVQQ